MKQIPFILLSISILFLSGCVDIDTLIKKGAYAEAEEQAASLKPGEQVFAYIRIGNGYFGQSEYDKARSCYEKAGIKGDADFSFTGTETPEIILAYANTALMSGQYEAAGLLYAKIGREPDREIARYLFSINDYLPAGDFYTKAGDTDQAAVCYGLYADRLAEKGEYQDAAIFYEKAGKKENAAGCYRKLAAAAIKNDNYPLAEEFLLKAGDNAKTGIADLLFSMKEYEKAASWYEKAGEGKKAADCYEIIAKAFFTDRKFAEAALYFEKANLTAQAKGCYELLAAEYRKNHDLLTAALYYEKAGNQAEADACRAAFFYETDDTVPLHHYTFPDVDIRSAVLLANSRIAFIAAGSNSISLFDISTGKALPGITTGENNFQCLALSADRKLLAAGRINGTITLFSTESLLPVRTFEQVKGTITVIAFSADSATAAAAGSANIIYLFNTATGEQTADYNEKAGIRSLALARNGEIVVYTNSNNTLKIRNIRLKKQLAALDDYPGSLVLTPEPEKVIACHGSGALHLVSLETGKVVKTYQGRETPAIRAVLSGDGRLIASVGKYELAVFITESGKIVKYINNLRESYVTDFYTAADFLDDPAFLATCGTNGKIDIWITDRYASASEYFRKTGDTAMADRSGARSVFRNGYKADIDAAASPVLYEEVAVFLLEQKKLLSAALYFEKAGNAGKAAECYTAQADQYLAADATLPLKTIHDFPPVLAVRFGADPFTVFAGKGINSVLKWDIADERESFPFRNFTEHLTAMTISRDARYAVSLLSDGTIKAADLKTGRTGWTFTSGSASDPITAVAVSDDSRLAAAGTASGTLHIRDLANGAVILSWNAYQNRKITALAFTKDSRRIMLAAEDPALKLFDIKNEKQVREYTGYNGRINSLAFSGNSEYIAAGGTSRNIFVWDTASGQIKTVLTGHTDTITQADFSPSSAYIVSAGDDGSVKLWDIAQSECIKTWYSPGKQPIKSVAIDKETAFIAGGTEQGLVCFWQADADLSAAACYEKAGIREKAADCRINAALGFRQYEKAMELTAQRGAENPVLAVASILEQKGLLEKAAEFYGKAGDSRQQSECYRKIADAILNSDINIPMATLCGHAAAISSIAVSSHGRFNGKTGVAFLASGSMDGSVILRDYRSGKIIRVITENLKPVSSVAISPDGAYIAAGSTNGLIRIWETDSGRGIASLTGHEKSVNSVAFSADNSFLVSAGSDTTVRTWETKTGRMKKIFRGHTSDVWAAALSPDSSFIASCSSDKTIRIWETESGKLLQTMKGHEYGVVALEILPDNTHVISGSSDNTIKIWETGTGTMTRSIDAQTFAVSSIAVSRDGKLIASCGPDNIVRLRDYASGDIVLNLQNAHRSKASLVRISDDGLFLLSAGDDLAVKVWLIDRNRLAEEYLLKVTDTAESSQ